MQRNIFSHEDTMFEKYQKYQNRYRTVQVYYLQSHDLAELRRLEPLTYSIQNQDF